MHCVTRSGQELEAIFGLGLVGVHAQVSAAILCAVAATEGRNRVRVIICSHSFAEFKLLSSHVSKCLHCRARKVASYECDS